MKIFWLFFCFIPSFQIQAQKVTERMISKNEDGSHFVMEKISDENFEQWMSFAKQAEENRSNWQEKLYFIEGIVPQNPDDPDPLVTPLKDSDDQQIHDLIKNDANPMLTLKKKYIVLTDMADGIHNFKFALKNHERDLGDVWVVYLLNTFNPVTAQIGGGKFIEEIEMAMTVLVKEGSPVTMHMGIFRNPLHFMSNKKQHARISPLLHAFAANAVMQKYDGLQYMVTTPLTSMADIFKATLPKDSYAEGMNKEGAWIIRDMQKGKPRKPSDSGYEFVLFDRNINDDLKQRVLLINDANKKEYWWLVNSLHTSLDLHPYFVVKLKDLAGLFKKPVLPAKL